GGSTVGALRNPRGPVLIEPSNCTGVTLNGMHLTNHNVWTVHPVFDTNVTITNTTITTSGGNSDGIDPDSTMHMLIDHDSINTDGRHHHRQHNRDVQPRNQHRECRSRECRSSNPSRNWLHSSADHLDQRPLITVSTAIWALGDDIDF